MNKGTDPADARVQAPAEPGGVSSPPAAASLADAIKRHWEEQGDVPVAKHGAEYDSHV